MAVLPRPSASASLVLDLARIVGSEAVSTREVDRLAYARDAWIRDVLRRRAGEMAAAPEAVVWPGSPEEVARVLELADRLGVPVVPFGGGSGRVGGARPSRGGVVLDLKRMRAIRRLDEEALVVEAEAGIVGARLEATLARRGLTLGHAPASLHCSTLGGWLATRSAGQLSTLYGRIEDMTLGIELVSPRGRARRPAWHRTGPALDWAALVLGSEGCFGAITAASLRVRPRPETRRFECFHFRSLERGLEGMRRIVQCGLRPAVLRLYDPLDTMLGRGGRGELPTVGEASPLDLLGSRLPRWLTGQGKLAEGAERARLGVLRRTTKALLTAPLLINRALEAFPDECLLVAGFEGPAAATRADADLARALLAAEGGAALGAAPGEHWYRHRFDVPFRQSTTFASGLFVDTLEVVATWDRLDRVHRAVQKAIGREALVMAHFSHPYPEGCGVTFTFTAPAGSARDPEEALERHERIAGAAMSAVLETGGCVSHHHGVGEAKAEAARRERGPGATRLLSALGAAFDPARIMNPGKLGLERYVPPRPFAGGRGGLPREIAAAVGERNLFARGGRTVVRPPDERALLALVRVAYARGVALVSDQSEAPPDTADAVSLDLERLEGILRISQHASFVECEAGVSVERLEAVLEETRLTLGPIHPTARERSVGAALAHGLLDRRGIGPGEMRGECFALRAVLPAGDVVETGAVPRASVGPDLTRLFVGATGRFGIITKVALRLARRPPYGAELRYRLPDVASALGVARGALRAGVAPWAGRVGVGDEGPELAFRLGAASEAGLAAWAAVLSAGAEAAGGRRLPVTSGGAEAGSFVAGLEVEAGWSRVLAVFEAVARDAKATPWVDFMTPEGATVVFEARDGGARETALRAAEAAGGRVVRAPRPRGAAGATAPGPFAAAESALAAALDPPG